MKDLGAGVVKYITSGTKLEAEPLSVSGKVTAKDDLTLQFGKSGDIGIIEGAKSRLIQSEEYSELIGNRGMGFILGCTSQNR